MPHGPMHIHHTHITGTRIQMYAHQIKHVINQLVLQQCLATPEPLPQRAIYVPLTKTRRSGASAAQFYGSGRKYYHTPLWGLRPLYTRHTHVTKACIYMYWCVWPRVFFTYSIQRISVDHRLQTALRSRWWPYSLPMCAELISRPLLLSLGNLAGV